MYINLNILDGCSDSTKVERKIKIKKERAGDNVMYVEGRENKRKNTTY